jgi:hypothetical protein
MIINFGKEHKGKSVIEVMMKHPEYVNWVLRQTNVEEPLKTVRNEMLRLIGIFNSKPFTKKCFGNNCGKTAIRCTSYKDDIQGLYWWCDNCDPYQSGAHSGTLHFISTYEDVLGYVRDVCKNRKTDSVALIKRLAQEKGLPKRLKKGDIDKYFLEKGILTF